MAEISKQALQVANNTDFPDNNSGYITPALLRDFNTDMIDSTVNQAQYTSNSGSWNNSISALNTFTSSQQPAFTALNAFTASQLSINSGVNSFTQSTNASIVSLTSEVDTLQAFTSSINEIRDDGVLQGYSTRFYFGGLVSASIVPNVNGAIASITVESDSTKLSTSSFNAYTASQAIFNASATASISQLLNFSSSLDVTYVTQTELASATGSLQNSIDTKLNTSSFNAYTQSITALGFATTGSNVFIGDETISDATGNTVTFQSYSGSLLLTAKSISSGSSTLSHITSSANQANFIFKANSSTGETILSGSNNLIANQTNPTTGFRKLITNGNIGLAGAALPQFSSSMAFSPTVNSNYFANVNTPVITARGPVSSSTWTIQHNGMFGSSVSLGTAAATNFEKATNGFSMIGNVVIGGGIQATAYKTNFIGVAAMSVASNFLGGTVFLNAESSSISLNANTIQNTSFRVDNSYYNASATGPGGAVSLQGNAIFGGNFVVYASGSNTTAALQRQFNNNIVAGTFNSASVNLNGDSSGMFATAIIGHGLNVTGSNTQVAGALAKNNTYGSAFFGRFNAENGNRARTAETVFAIGTGTTSAPKTGFLIDSGSNTFVEGTLNVSGSLLFTGSVYGNVVSASIASSTASIDLSSGNYFTLTLAGTTNINVTNPRPGVTATLVITTDTAASASFSSNVKQPSGSAYVASPSGNIDIISFTAVNSSTVYAFPAQSFV